jgi:predicted nucleotidyltransferase
MVLKHLITSKAKRSLLKLLLTNPKGEFYTREVARLTGEPLNAVRRELGHLEKAGLVRSRRSGNLKYYSVIREFPFYREMKRIVYGTVGLGDYLADRLKDSKQVELAFVYGSVARDEETPKSDIDLFVVGEVDEDDLHEVVSQVEKDIGREISYVLMSRAEFDKRLKNKEPFVRRVMAEDKVVLKGNPDVY